MTTKLLRSHAVRIGLVMWSIAMALSPDMAQASTVIYHDALSRDYAVGIKDLDIGQVRYNVRFVSGTFRNVFGDPNRSDFQPPPFWGDELAVIDAASAIAAVLNNESPVAFLDPGFIPTAFLVPFNSSGTGAGTMMNFVNACGGGGTWVGFCGDGVSVLNGFASLAEISVPEPASAWLTAVAALAMLGVRRTRRQSMR